MTRFPARRTALALLALTAALAAGQAPRPGEKAKGGPQLAHSVFIRLKDRTPEARARLAASCHKHLGPIEGATHFAVGTIAEDVVEPVVSIRDFDVSLLIVFESKEAEAKYLVDPRHLRFVAENKASFAGVRVFDTYLTVP